MSDEQTISRRSVLKILAVGVAGATHALGQTPHPHTGVEMITPAATPTEVSPRFFNAMEMAAITVMSDLIIPADEQSPGAREAGVPAFIDLMISESSVETKNLWRNGLAAVERLSQKEFSSSFGVAKPEQQLALVKQIARNEYQPRKIEERFFIAIKGLTVDGYYTSQIGIHQDLHYKGNANLAEFTGCTHPEHTS
jgi:gluconate 2-dehydrogenase gamma chain